MMSNLETLSNLLHLKFYPQDWGIINANKDRVIEFISFYNENENLESFLKCELFELIIASMNEALLAEQEPGLLIIFQDFIVNNGKDKNYESILKYWVLIKNKDEFPVGFLIPSSSFNFVN